MYAISNAYRAKMLDQVQTHRLTGKIDGIDFTDADVIGVSYVNQCSDKKVNVGSVYIGTLKLTFLTDILNRGEYQGKTITISDGLLIDPDTNTFEDVPVGKFIIGDAKWTAANMVEVTAYDGMSLLDKSLNLDETSGTIFSFCQYIETETGVVFGMTEEACQALPNGTEIIAPYSESDIQTFRDLLSGLAQMIGGFAYCGRDGKFYLRRFDDLSVITVPKNRRVSGAKFSDFTTLYDTVQFTEIDIAETRYIGDGNGLVMNLGSQAFLQYGTTDAINRRARNIADSIKDMRYQPYDVGMLPAFIALDLGDVVSFSDDYSGDTTKGAVMSLAWTYNKSFKVHCYGDNPNLRAVQTLTDKNISGILNRTAQNEVVYYNYANIEALTFGSEVETTVASLRFTAAQQTTVKILHEFIMDMTSDLSADGSYEVKYYLDGELVSYSPYERIQGIYGASSGNTDFSICRDFFYIVKDVEAGQSHTWEVKIITHGISSTTIDVNHAHVTLEGQRLYGEKYWGGYIDAKDNISVAPFGYLGLVSITETPVVSFQSVLFPSNSDNIGYLPTDDLGLSAIEEGTGALSPHIFFQTIEGYILTDSGDYLTDDSGNRFIL